MLNKIISALITTMMLASFIPVASAQETQPLLYEDFETYTGGAIDGWKEFSNPKTQFSAWDFGDSRGNCMAIKAADETKSPLIRYEFENALSDENIYRISFYIRTDNPEGGFLMMFHDSDGSYYKSFATSSSIHFYTIDQGSYTDTLCEEYLPDSWYKAEIYLDLSNDKVWYVLTDKYGEVYEKLNYCILDDLKDVQMSQSATGNTVYMDDFAIELADRENIEKWVNEGAKVPDEVAYPLEMSISSDNMGNIFFDDEEAQLYLDLKNREEKSHTKTLHISLKNVDGKEIWSKDETITLDVLEETRIAFVPGMKKYGTYTLDITDGGKTLCRADLSRSVRNTELNYRIGIYTPGRSGSDVNVMNLASNAGFGYAQLRLRWGEDENGNIINPRTDALTDSFIGKSLELGMKVSGNMDIGKSDLYPNPDGGFSTTPEALEGIEKYYRRTAEMLKGQVENFSASYEVVYVTNNDGTRGNGSEYAEVLKAAYTGMKEGNPDAKLSAFNDTIVMPESRQLYREALDTMREWGTYYFDAIGTHPFTSHPPESDSASGWFSLDGYLDEIVTEYGLEGKIRWANSLGYFPYKVTEEEVAQHYVRQLLLNEALDSYDALMYMQLQSLYSHDANYGMLRHWKGVNTPDSAKPQYVVFSWWNKLMNGAEFVNMENTDDKYICNFTKDGRKITALWDVSDSHDKAIIPTNGKSVSVYDMYGNLIDSESTNSTITLEYSVKPVYVVEDEAKEDIADTSEMKPLIDVINITDLWNSPLLYTAQ